MKPWKILFSLIGWVTLAAVCAVPVYFIAVVATVK
jgi:hypothetical protein